MGYRGLLICSALLAACYEPPTIASGTVACGGANGDCPSGYTCACDGFCRATTAARRAAPGDPLPPPVEHGVWTKVAGIGDRRKPSLAFDPIRNETILFSGEGSDELGGDTWAWDGNRWSWRSDAGPQVRIGAGMAFDHARGEMVLFSGECSYFCATAETWIWDGVQWRQVAATGPRQLELATMVDDEARAQVLVFGGRHTTTSDELWAWNGTAWRQLCTDAACAANRPEGRAEHGMAYDRGRQRTVIFGGADATNTRLADVWEWDGTQWTQACTSAACMASAPTAREGHAMYYDPVRQRVVVIGGFIPATGYTDEQWEWDGVQWHLSTETRPNARYLASAALDETRGVPVLHGGTNADVSIAELDTWEHGAAGWTRVSDGSPSASEEPGVAYDPVRGTVVVFAGRNATNSYVWEWTEGARYTRSCGHPNCESFGLYTGPLVYDEARAEMLWFDTPSLVWSWANGTWTQKCTQAPCNTTLPAGTNDPTVTYDRKRGIVVVATSANELWAWNGTSFTQLCTDAPCLANRPAVAPGDSSLGYDREREVVVHYSNSGQTWEWNGTAWTRVCMTSPCADATPSPRSQFSQIAYHPVRKTVQLFGGYTMAGQRADLWEWNGTVWQKLSDGGPLPRTGAGLVFNERRGRMTLHGGGSDEGVALLADTWEFHFRGGACTSGAQCDSGFCTDGVCCDQAACGTCEACNVGIDAGRCVTLTDREDADTCSGTNVCGASGTCGLVTGEPCALDTDCASGRCSTDPCAQVCL